MKKEFDLFKWIVIASVVAVGLILTGIALVGFDFAMIKADLSKPLEIKNWHFALIIMLLLNRK